MTPILVKYLIICFSEYYMFNHQIEFEASLLYSTFV